MNPEIEALQEAISLSKENLLNSLLAELGYKEVDEELFQRLLEIVSNEDINRFKLTEALQSQTVIDKVLKDNLI